MKIYFLHSISYKIKVCKKFLTDFFVAKTGIEPVTSGL